MSFTFLVDNHADSEVPGFDGPFSSLDLCKFATEQFRISVRQAALQHSIEHSWMLFDSSADMACTRSIYGDPSAVFDESIKMMKAATTERNISFSLSHLFAVVNEYRIRNRKDRFSCGRMPWVMEPAVVVILTDGKSLSESIKLTPGKISSGCELYVEPFRWDHRIFTFLVAPKGDESASCHPDLESLSKASGGEVFICRGKKEIIFEMKMFAQKVCKPSVVVKFTHLSASNDLNNSSEAMVQHATLQLSSSSIGELRYPIPEAEFVDKNIDTLLIRSCHPIISIATKGKARETSDQWLALAAHLKVPTDRYEVSLTTGSSGSDSGLAQGTTRETSATFCKVLGLSQTEKYLVYVSGSGRNESGHVGVSSDPFGILCPSRSSATGVELVLLPYNFPRLLPILKRAQDLKGSGQHVSVSSQLRNEMTAYVRGIPGYTYHSVSHVLVRLRIPQLFSFPESCVYGNAVQRRLDRLEQLAGSSVAALERASRERWPELAPDPGQIVQLQRQVRMDGRYGSEQSFLDGLAFPSNVATVPKDKLLGTWEKMRANIYGVSGHALRGRYIRGNKNSTGGYLPARVSRIDELGRVSDVDPGSLSTDVLSQACGIAPVSLETVAFMSSYAERLARAERLRDPLLKNPPADEDEPSGILRRKLVINFGNPFKSLPVATSEQLSPSRASGVCVGGREGEGEGEGEREGEGEGERGGGGGGGGGDVVGSPSFAPASNPSGLSLPVGMQGEAFADGEINSAAESLFADTPIPARYRSDSDDEGGVSSSLKYETVRGSISDTTLAKSTSGDGSISPGNKAHMYVIPTLVPPTRKRRKSTDWLATDETARPETSQPIPYGTATPASTPYGTAASASAAVAPAPYGAATRSRNDSTGNGLAGARDAPSDERKSLPFATPESSPMTTPTRYGESESKAAPNLPPDWQEHFSKSKQKKYWFNTRTGESIWIRPES
jgi:hypothetical protein